MVAASTGERYWSDYTALQAVKHDLLRRYLGGWYPSLASLSGRILYLDTHAGPGRHVGGESGSAVIALRALLDHRAKAGILAKCEVIFYFIELDEEYADALRANIAQLGDLPERVTVHVINEGYEEALKSLLGYLGESNKRMAPAFVFVDPFGFKLPYALLAEFMKFPAVELFVNVSWYNFHKALVQAQRGAKYVSTMNYILTEAWKGRITSGDYEGRLQETLSLMKDVLGAQWVTPVRMLNEKNSTQHLLVHFTNHPYGRELMKGAMWGTCDVWDGQFWAHKDADLDQGVLLSAEPDLSPLRELARKGLETGGDQQWTKLVDRIQLLDTVWLEKHLNDSLRDLRDKEGVIGYSGGHFGRKNNPLIWLK